jgi:hypothetical protein
LTRFEDTAGDAVEVTPPRPWRKHFVPRDVFFEPECWLA